MKELNTELKKVLKVVKKFTTNYNELNYAFYNATEKRVESTDTKSLIMIDMDLGDTDFLLDINAKGDFKKIEIDENTSLIYFKRIKYILEEQKGTSKKVNNENELSFASIIYNTNAFIDINPIIEYNKKYDALNLECKDTIITYTDNFSFLKYDTELNFGSKKEKDFKKVTFLTMPMVH